MLTSADHVCGARRLPFGAVSHVFCGWSIRINNWCCSVCILKVLPVLFCVCWFSVSLRRSLRRRHDVNPIFYVHDSQHRIFSFFFLQNFIVPLQREGKQCNNNALTMFAIVYLSCRSVALVFDLFRQRFTYNEGIWNQRNCLLDGGLKE